MKKSGLNKLLYLAVMLYKKFLIMWTDVDKILLSEKRQVK